MVSASDFKREGPGVYTKDGKRYQAPGGSLQRLVASLNKSSGKEDKKGETGKSAITAQERATGAELEKAFLDRITAPQDIQDTLSAEILNLIRGGIAPATAQDEGIEVFRNLASLSGQTSPEESAAMGYLREVMNQGMSPLERDAYLARGSGEINRNLLGTLRGAMGAGAGMGVSGGFATNQTQANQNLAGQQLRELSRDLILADLGRRDAAAGGLGEMAGAIMTRRGDQLGAAGVGLGNIGGNQANNRLNLFNTMVNGLISQQGFMSNLQATNQANKSAYDLSRYGAFLGGIQTASAAAQAERMNKLATQQLDIARLGAQNRGSSGNGTMFQIGTNSAPTFPDPGQASPQQPTNTGGF